MTVDNRPSDQQSTDLGLGVGTELAFSGNPREVLHPEEKPFDETQKKTKPKHRLPKQIRVGNWESLDVS